MVKNVLILATVLMTISNVNYANELPINRQSINSKSVISQSAANYEVTTNNLNIRANATSNSKIIGKLNKKNKIAVLQIKNNWAKISYKNSYGYVHSKYIKKLATSNSSSLTKYIVNTNDLNIRSVASSKGKIVGKLNTGDIVEVYSISKNWAKIKNGSSVGYVYGKYINKYTGATVGVPNVPIVPKPEETPANPPSNQQSYIRYTVITNSLNVRAKASSSSRKLGSLSDGTVVNVYRISNGWAEIKYNGKTAYISANYLCKLIDKDKLNDIKILVNKNNSVGKDYVPSDLITLNVKFKSGIATNAKKMRSEPGKALEKMFSDAKKSNVNLIMYSGYRSYVTQKSIYASNVSSMGTHKADLISAKAGLSEHQTGLSVDVVSTDYLSLDQGFAKTKAYKWIENNAAKYGFIIRYPKGKTNITGYSFEPWHLRYVGVETAKAITVNNLTLEEYLK